MIKRLVAVVIVSAVSVLMVSPASAHVLKTNGTIGAILHIAPDDNPQSGQLTSYLLEFSDTTNQFTLSKCDCTLAMQANGQTISSAPLNASSNLDSQNRFMFPTPAVYTLVVTGQPKQAGAFQPFALKYLVRVEGGIVTPRPVPPLLWLGLGLAVGLGLLGGYRLAYHKKWL